MIINWNSKDVNTHGVVFHFKNSSRPFIEVMNYYDESLFVDLNSMVAYTYDDIIIGEKLEFYSCEDVGSDNKDFRGIEIDGRFEWVDKKEI